MFAFPLLRPFSHLDQDNFNCNSRQGSRVRFREMPGVSSEPTPLTPFKETDDDPDLHKPWSVHSKTPVTWMSLFQDLSRVNSVEPSEAAAAQPKQMPYIEVDDRASMSKAERTRHEILYGKHQLPPPPSRALPKLPKVCATPESHIRSTKEEEERFNFNDAVINNFNKGTRSLEIKREPELLSLKEEAISNRSASERSPLKINSESVKHKRVSGLAGSRPITEKLGRNGLPLRLDSLRNSDSPHSRHNCSIPPIHDLPSPLTTTKCHKGKYIKVASLYARVPSTPQEKLDNAPSDETLHGSNMSLYIRYSKPESDPLQIHHLAAPPPQNTPPSSNSSGPTQRKSSRRKSKEDNSACTPDKLPKLKSTHRNSFIQPDHGVQEQGQVLRWNPLPLGISAIELENKKTNSETINEKPLRLNFKRIPKGPDRKRALNHELQMLAQENPKVWMQMKGNFYDVPCPPGSPVKTAGEREDRNLEQGKTANPFYSPSSPMYINTMTPFSPPEHSVINQIDDQSHTDQSKINSAAVSNTQLDQNKQSSLQKSDVNESTNDGIEVLDAVAEVFKSIITKLQRSASQHSTQSSAKDTEITKKRVVDKATDTNSHSTHKIIDRNIANHTTKKDTDTNKEEDTSSKDTCNKDTFGKETCNKYTSNKDMSNKDMSNKDTLHKDTSHEATSMKDTSNKYASNKDTFNKDTSHKDTSIKDTFNKDTSSKDTPNKGTFNKGASKKEASHEATSIKDTSIKDISIKDTSNKDASNKDTSIKDTSHKATSIKATSIKATPIKDTLIKDDKYKDIENPFVASKALHRSDENLPVPREVSSVISSEALEAASMLEKEILQVWDNKEFASSAVMEPIVESPHPDKKCVA